MFLGLTSRPVFWFITSLEPSRSKAIAGLAQSMACGIALARPSRREQWMRMSEDWMASGIAEVGSRPVNFIFSLRPRFSIFSFSESFKIPSPTKSQTASGNFLERNFADSIMYSWPFRWNSRAMVTSTVAFCGMLYFWRKADLSFSETGFRKDSSSMAEYAVVYCSGRPIPAASAWEVIALATLMKKSVFFAAAFSMAM